MIEIDFAKLCQTRSRYLVRQLDKAVRFPQLQEAAFAELPGFRWHFEKRTTRLSV